MWVTEDGRFNTNHWSHPEVVVPASVVRLVASLKKPQRKALASALQSDLVSNVFELVEPFANATTLAAEAAYVDQWLPPEVIAHLEALTSDGLAAELADVDIRWRIDAYDAVIAFMWLPRRRRASVG